MDDGCNGDCQANGSDSHGHAGCGVAPILSNHIADSGIVGVVSSQSSRQEAGKREKGKKKGKGRESKTKNKAWTPSFHSILCRNRSFA
jgi:hypothetical protein